MPKSKYPMIVLRIHSPKLIGLEECRSQEPHPDEFQRYGQIISIERRCGNIKVSLAEFVRSEAGRVSREHLLAYLNQRMLENKNHVLTPPEGAPETDFIDHLVKYIGGTLKIPIIVTRTKLEFITP